MEIKINYQQIIWGIIQFIGYAAVFFGLAYKLGKKVSEIETTITLTTRRLDKHIEGVERMFDRLWDERFKKKE